MHNSEEKPTSIGIAGYHHQNMFHPTASSTFHDPNNPSSSEIYNMDMNMMIGFPPKNKEAINEEYNYQNGTIMMVSTADHHNSSASWNNNSIIDQSLRSCVFPCEGNERPSQGLSLSLNTSNPSSIGIQSFELRQQQQHHDEDHLRFGPSSSSRSSTLNNINQQHQQNHLLQFHAVRNSKYLGPVQELLNEFCNLGLKQIDENLKMKKTTNEWGGQDDINGVKRQSFYSSLDLLELQKRKSKLLHMLEEVDRRYKHYCDQMKSVVSSFEAVAGNGAAKVYSSLASKAMSRHFRCLRDGIVSEIKATKKAMGDKDTTTPTTSNAALGTSKGETPRLRLLDQTLRQQKAFQQMTMIESHPWRPQRGLPERSVSVLRAWLFEHFLHPYPNDVDKHILARQTGLSRSQVSNWFINARVRLWKPMVEEMYLEELKEHDHNELNNMVNENDEKPSHEELLISSGSRNMDSECLSSIINHQNDQVEKRKNKSKNINEEEVEEEFGRVNMGSDSYGSAMELDFSSYNHHHNYGGNSSGVSLTLGLHQHEHGGNGGVSLAFSPASHEQGGSLFYHRENDNKMEDCQTTTTTTAVDHHEYSLLESDQNQNLPYRNLMGAQLLRDFAG